MVDKLKYVIDSHELTLTEGEFDTSVVLSTSEKGVLRQADGNFDGNEFDENVDILGDGTTHALETGILGTNWTRYTQANNIVELRQYAGRSTPYGWLFKVIPDIPSASTWGGAIVQPPPATQLLIGHKYRFIFYYRGYTPSAVNVYSSYTSGWSTNGVNLYSPWSQNVEGTNVDTDWEWKKYEIEFTATAENVNLVAGAYDWDSTTQYPGGDYGIRYNGDLYRHRLALAIPTLGVDPETEYLAGGVYDAKYVGGAAPGYFNIYRQIKIGCTYITQGARGTHFWISDISLTDITENQSFCYDLSENAWKAENLVEGTTKILAKGTAYVGIARSDDGTDVFAVEGNRYLAINDTVVYNTTGRGLTLTIITESTGSVVSTTTYDVHGGVATVLDSLASALSTITNSQLWVLTSFDAIGTEATHDAAPNLRNQLVSMGSVMWDKDNGDVHYLWDYNNASVRNPYAAVGRGQTLVKEDGSNGSDPNYKRKGVIDIRL